jgi:hypothetical protein
VLSFALAVRVTQTKEAIMTNKQHTQPEASDQTFLGWSIEDVQQIRPDLTDQQARDVLSHCERRFDASIGINWDILELHADELFPSG